MLKKFKEFAFKGNVMDLAVGVIVGAAFSKIVNSLVSDVISPLLGIFFKMDFQNLFVVLTNPEKVPNLKTLDQARAAGANVLAYGSFLTNIINFLIVAGSIFLVIYGIGKIKDKIIKQTPPLPTTKKCPYCKSDINIEAIRCPQCTSVLDSLEE
ncbi:MAG: large conductance mechanosensitive channel protein MscL [Clostridiales bacterium]|nr:large conductance mechanosensitive channel protein MscL [Clostridiales bacterium]